MLHGFPEAIRARVLTGPSGVRGVGRKLSVRSSGEARRGGCDPARAAGGLTARQPDPPNLQVKLRARWTAVVAVLQCSACPPVDDVASCEVPWYRVAQHLRCVVIAGRSGAVGRHVVLARQPDAADSPSACWAVA